MPTIFILIEQALGYCLLKVKHCKSSDELLVLLQDKIFENIKKKIILAEFQPFSSVNNASLNCQDIANGNANEDLVSLLKKHLQEGHHILVVSDRKLLESLKAANINDFLEFNADSSMIMLLRRVRFSIHEFMGDSEQHTVRAHVGLGHSFSRMKIKFNINRADNMIIQSINLMDQLDKDINTMAMRLREWFGYHYPELVKIVPDNRAYSTVVGIIGSRAGAVDDVFEQLELAVSDSSRARQIISNARTSMGYELMEEDFLNIGHLAKKTLSMMIQREDSAKYLASKMAQVAPNFSTLVGDIVAARLISHAGSLINLAKFPASTIQILGAEKALFRALKTRTNTPKYGLIFHSSFIGRASKNDKGRISRFLAAKISLAVRLDCFLEEPMNIFGIHFKKQVEDQLKYLETGVEPKKNYEAMAEAVKDAKRYIAQMKVSRGAIDSNGKLTESAPMGTNESSSKKVPKIVTEADNIATESKKRRKKKKKGVNGDATTEDSRKTNTEEMRSDAEAAEPPKKTKKKGGIDNQSNGGQLTEASSTNIGESLGKKKKKKKKRIMAEEETTIAVNNTQMKTKRNKEVRCEEEGLMKAKKCKGNESTKDTKRGTDSAEATSPAKRKKCTQ